MHGPRGRITAASWIMVPAHAGLSITLGLIWIKQSEARQSITLSALQSHGVAPHTVAGVLIVLGCIDLIGMTVGYLWIIGPSLFGAGVIYLALGWVASDAGPTESLGGVPIWIYIALAHFASTLSLALSETDSGVTR